MMAEVPIEPGMIAASRRVVLLVDAQKFSAGSTVRLCGAGELDLVVTGCGRGAPSGGSFRVQGRRGASMSITMLAGGAFGRRWSMAPSSTERSISHRRGGALRCRCLARVEPVLARLARERGRRAAFRSTLGLDEALEGCGLRLRCYPGRSARGSAHRREGAARGRESGPGDHRARRHRLCASDGACRGWSARSGRSACPASLVRELHEPAGLVTEALQQGESLRQLRRGPAMRADRWG